MARVRTDALPLLPIRGRVVFPDTLITFDVGRLGSLAAVHYATSQSTDIFVVAQINAEDEEVKEDGLYTVGTVVRLKSVSRLPANNIRVTVEGVYRAKITRTQSVNEVTLAYVEEISEVHSDENIEEAYFRTAKEMVKEASGYDGKFQKDVAAALERCDDSEKFVNIAANSINLNVARKQAILEESRTVERLSLIDTALGEELEIMRIERKISATVRQNIDKNQKEYYLREQLRAIHTELGDDEEEKDELERRIDQKNLPEEVKDKAKKELSRMVRMQSSSADYNVLRMYLDWILDLPWTECTKDNDDLAAAVKILNDDHYGLEKVKERITEFLAVMQLTGGLNGPILCLVGPPGVGKTSIATSIARALGRKFVRMSLGGVSDEAEIRGHRKTYVGAIPGRIIAGMKNAGTINPVFLLDEIDKLANDRRGDPASALLEVLDPAQNSTFRDRYLELPYDLSKTLFITTANTLDTVPRPLLDRMEVIQLDGYTGEEKREIAKRYLIPKRKKANGLGDEQLTISDGAIDEMISNYTAEAGVRNLERTIDAVCRKAAVKIATKKAECVKVTERTLEGILGPKRFERDLALSADEVGAATGLAWTSVGGTTLTIEVSAMQGKGDILLTGKLGDVMKESARAAISYIRSNGDIYGIPAETFDTTDLHIHVPEGATPKDGPSAGITMACAILSAFTKKPVKSSVAMTGEITLRGKVLPIGGLKEKALAAYRVGVKDVIIPEGNKKDLGDIPAEVKKKLNFIPVDNVDAVFKSAIVGM